MYVCMYVCMHVCMYVCIYVCMYVCTYVCMYICIYIYMHARKRLRLETDLKTVDQAAKTKRAWDYTSSLSASFSFDFFSSTSWGRWARRVALLEQICSYWIFVPLSGFPSNCLVVMSMAEGKVCQFLQTMSLSTC